MADDNFNKLCNFCKIESIEVSRVTDFKCDAKIIHLKWRKKTSTF